MIFSQHTTLPQLSTFNTTQTDQYYTSNGGFLQTNPQPMSFTGPDMDMLMQDIDMSNFSPADLDAVYSPPKGSNGMPLRHQSTLT
jgi:hypothetical protein